MEGNHCIPTESLKRGRAARNLAHLFHTWRLKEDEAPLVHSSLFSLHFSASFRPTPKNKPEPGREVAGSFPTYDDADDRERKLPQQITKASNRMFQKHWRQPPSSNNPGLFELRKRIKKGIILFVPVIEILNHSQTFSKAKVPIIFKVRPMKNRKIKFRALLLLLPQHQAASLCSATNKLAA